MSSSSHGDVGVEKRSDSRSTGVALGGGGGRGGVHVSPSVGRVPLVSCWPGMGNGESCGSSEARREPRACKQGKLLGRCLVDSFPHSRLAREVLPQRRNLMRRGGRFSLLVSVFRNLGPISVSSRRGMFSGSFFGGCGWRDWMLLHLGVVCDRCTGCVRAAPSSKRGKQATDCGRF